MLSSEQEQKHGGHVDATCEVNWVTALDKTSACVFCFSAQKASED